MNLYCVTGTHAPTGRKMQIFCKAENETELCKEVSKRDELIRYEWKTLKTPTPQKFYDQFKNNNLNT